MSLTFFQSMPLIMHGQQTQCPRLLHCSPWLLVATLFELHSWHVPPLAKSAAPARPPHHAGLPSREQWGETNFLPTSVTNAISASDGCGSGCEGGQCEATVSDLSMMVSVGLRSQCEGFHSQL